MLARLESIIDNHARYFPYLLFFVFALSIILAGVNIFIQDDAFISFRYAKNFVDGVGLVYNPNEYVEGYTNFSWVMLMALAISLGFDPILASYVGGFFFFTLCLLMVGKLAYKLTESNFIVLLTILALGTNYSFSSYTTGGLETMMQSALLVSSIYLFFSLQHLCLRRAIGLSLILTLALVTRLDSAIIAIPILAVLGIRWMQDRRYDAVLALGLPMLILMSAWLIWKLFYYGDILPNTYYVKGIPLSQSIERGWNYIDSFLLTYSLWVFIPLIVFFGLKDKNMRFLALLLVLWTLYIFKAGGDFMEFRFIVPLLPLFFILMFNAMKCFLPRIIISMILLVIIHTSYSYAQESGRSVLQWEEKFRYVTVTSRKQIETIDGLSAHLYGKRAWIKIGKALAVFQGTGAKMAMTPAGAMPYYSGLYTIDIRGLNYLYFNKQDFDLTSNSSLNGHSYSLDPKMLHEKGVHLFIPSSNHDTRLNKWSHRKKRI